MSAGTWHLEALGLPPHADTLAVRRAYAKALRAMDPATDPEGFARLRAAYEAARAWCEQHDAVDAPPTMASSERREENAADPDPSDDGSSLQLEAPPLPPDDTVTLAWRFVADVGMREPDAIPALLEASLASVRTQYIDAPGQFEEHLIDLVGMQRIAHRPEVFAAAEAQFRWNEVGHLAALGQRGQWIEQVLAERDTWLDLAAERRVEWQALFARADAGRDNAMVRRWPEIAPLHARYPAWLSLYAANETFDAWRAAFEALPDDTRDEYTRRAPSSEAYLPARVAAQRAKTRSRSEIRTVAVFVLALVLGLAHMLLQASRDEHGAAFVPPPLPEEPLTPRQCVELYAQMDRPEAWRDVPVNEVARMKARARRCERAGHWHAPTRQP